MKNTKDKISLVYKFLILVITAIGLYLNFKFVSFKTGIVYFTLQSNILCLLFYTVLFVYLLINKNNKNIEKNKKLYIIFKGLISANIFLTMTIYTVLAVTNNIHVYDAHFIECLFVHYLTPIMVIMDYVLFDEKGNMEWYHPLIWDIIPIAYMVFNIIYTKSGGKFMDSKYAYSFLNAEKYGYMGVVLNCMLIFVFFTAVNYFVFLIDKKVGENNEEK